MGMTFTAAILYVELLTRARDPEKRLEDILKETEYFDPKDIVQKRERVQETEFKRNHVVGIRVSP